MPTLFLDPTSNGATFNWSGSYANVDDGVRQPSSSTGGYIGSSNEGQVAELNVDDIGAINGTATEVKLWIRTSIEPGNPNNIKWGGVYQTEASPSYSSSNWYYLTFSVNTDLSSGLTNNGIRFKCSDYEDDEVEATYLEVTYTSNIPEITVTGLSDTGIADGDTTPNLTDGTDFGTASESVSTVTRVFKVTNTGGADLTVGTPTVPDGFTLTEDLSSPIAAGGNDTFSVRLDNTDIGTKTGQISFTNNDDDEAPFNFTITGDVIGRTLRLESDSFTSPDANGTDCNTITGWGGTDTPQIHMLVAMTNESAVSTSIQNGIGWATNTIDHCIGLSSHNDVGTSKTRRIYRDDFVANPINNSATPGNYENATQSSYSTTQICHSWTNSANEGYPYATFALGGTHITDVGIETITTPTSNGDVSYTGFGFKPDCLIVIHNFESTTVPTAIQVGGYSAMGMSDGTTDVSVASASRDGLSSATDTSSVLCSDFIRTYDPDGGATTSAATVKSLDATGYTLTWGTTDATARKVTIIGIKGVFAKVVRTTQPTTNTDVDIDIGVIPRGGICLSAIKTTSETVSDHNRMMVGSWADQNSNAQWSASWYDEHNVMNTDTDRARSATKAISYYDHDQTLTGEATVAAQGNGIRETWESVDGTEREHAWLLLSEPQEAAAASSTDDIHIRVNALMMPALSDIRSKL